MARRDVDFVFARLHGVADAAHDEVAQQVQLVDGCVGKVHAALPENAVLLVLGGPGRHVAPLAFSSHGRDAEMLNVGTFSCRADASAEAGQRRAGYLFMCVK